MTIAKSLNMLWNSQGTFELIFLSWRILCSSRIVIWKKKRTKAQWFGKGSGIALDWCQISHKFCLGKKGKLYLRLHQCNPTALCLSPYLDGSAANEIATITRLLTLELPTFFASSTVVRFVLEIQPVFVVPFLTHFWDKIWYSTLNRLTRAFRDYLVFSCGLHYSD